ncbi:MAG: hypothetical protein ACRCYY_09760 [Trueperaceae bacterium]
MQRCTVSKDDALDESPNIVSYKIVGPPITLSAPQSTIVAEGFIDEANFFANYEVEAPIDS